MVSACCADGLCVENVVVFRKPGTTRYCGRGIRQLWSIAAFFGTSRSPQRMQGQVYTIVCTESAAGLRRRSSASFNISIKPVSTTGFAKTLQGQHSIISRTKKVTQPTGSHQPPSISFAPPRVYFLVIVQFSIPKTCTRISPVTPTTKSCRPIPRSLATTPKPDSTGISLSKKMTS